MHGEHMNSSAFMIVQNDMKLIFHSNAENQLFNLTSDPKELNAIENEQLEARLISCKPPFKRDNHEIKNISALESELGEDPMAIAKKVDKYNYESFKEWKTAQGDSYEERISSLRWEIDFKKDTQKNLKLIEEWSNKSL